MSENVTPAGDHPPRGESQEPLRDRVVELYAVGYGVPAMAAELCVTERTIYRWLRDPSVRERINEIRAAAVGSVSGRMQDRLREWMDRLDALTEDEDKRVRLRALHIASDLTLKLRAFDEFELRLAALETWREQATGGKREGATA